MAKQASVPVQQEASKKQKEYRETTQGIKSKPTGYGETGYTITRGEQQIQVERARDIKTGTTTYTETTPKGEQRKIDIYRGKGGGGLIEIKTEPRLQVGQYYVTKSTGERIIRQNIINPFGKGYADINITTGTITPRITEQKTTQPISTTAIQTGRLVTPLDIIKGIQGISVPSPIPEKKGETAGQYLQRTGFDVTQIPKQKTTFETFIEKYATNPLIKQNVEIGLTLIQKTGFIQPTTPENIAFIEKYGTSQQIAQIKERETTKRYLQQTFGFPMTQEQYQQYIFLQGISPAFKMAGIPTFYIQTIAEKTLLFPKQQEFLQ